MRLILNGGGDGGQVKESYELFAHLVNGGKVLYIPLAWNNGNMEKCIEWFKSEMIPFGVTDIEDVLDAKDITKEKLSKYAGIFIGGGNTYKLLKMLKETDAFDSINDFLDRGGIVMGGSAGALIFGKSIDTCLDDGLDIKCCVDKNLVGLKDTKGFDYIKGYSILPHYKKLEEQNANTKKRVNRLISNGFKLICLPEETSLYINNDEFTIIGQKPAKIITKNKTQVVEPNNICYLTK